MRNYRTLSQKWEDAVAEVLALDTHAKAQRKSIGRTRNWGRILDWHGTSPRARYNRTRWGKNGTN